MVHALVFRPSDVILGKVTCVYSASDDVDYDLMCTPSTFTISIV